ncbi:M56 family metallopeptidase [Reichenbachiella ulvae]|uniref:M56 family metallopeptidase n=1 Tax=Reichenbachiella ulvae TaxID=2980104 RepID=A0ABT3CXN3_9BACT|nr:M56 family metallopeptidase [Reichenbachiella ulvae]MCV9388397.1 M56 family metallopeptidase [Reichenbachiella ulvae]
MRSEMINYLVEANVVLLLAGLVYFLLLQREHHFQLRRFFVLFSTVAALLIPLMDFTLSSSSGVQEGSPVIYLPTFTIGTGDLPSEAASIDWWQWAFYAYVSISSIALGAFLYQLLMIWKLTRSGQNSDSSAIYQVDGSIPSFSFFGYIFVNEDTLSHPEERDKIIAHERIHVAQWHSADMVLLYLSRALFWFNPVAWFFKTAQQETHEYLVDQQMIQQEDKSAYQALLAKMTLSPYYRTGSYFAKSQTLKRINMMNEKLKRPNRFRIGVALGSMLLMATVLACNEDVITMVDSAQMVADIPPGAQKELDKLRKEYPNERFNYLEILAPTDSQLSLNDLDIDPETVQWMGVNKNEGYIGLILVANENFKRLVEYKKSADGVYDVVEERPEPINGMPAFYEFIGQNMTYPTQAREAGVEGRVYVQFIIDEEGNLSDVRPVKGIGSGCDQEAVRVIRSAAPWKPGKQDGQAVKVRMVLPITFKLGDSEKKLGKLDDDKPEDHSSENMEEMVVVGYGSE